MRLCSTKASERDWGLEERRRRRGERKREREREDGVLSAKCNLNREERTMGGEKKSHCSFFFSNVTVINM